MGQSKKIPNQRRQEEEEVQEVIPNWLELCPDLLRCVFKRLSFTELSRAKSVCSLWYSSSTGCVPKQNQIPWLILFPSKEKGNNENNDKSSCVLFVPDDKDKVYTTRDLGVDFTNSRWLATYGSWLLMMIDRFCDNIYILNPLTRERIDLPDTKSRNHNVMEVCFWIDNRTKEYLVILRTYECTMFTKKGVNKWHELNQLGWIDEIVYNHKNQKLYIYYGNRRVKIWDFSGDKPCEDGFLEHFSFNHFDFGEWKNLLEIKTRIALTLSGDVLLVVCGRMKDYKTWRFLIYKANHVKWEAINSLGDEALILDMGITVVAKDVLGITRNSIYFSRIDDRRNNHPRDDPNHIFVFDLTTQKMELLPQCVSSSIQFSDARWFFPGLNG